MSSVDISIGIENKPIETDKGLEGEKIGSDYLLKMGFQLDDGKPERGDGYTTL
jgi:hypothetical protein